MGFDFNNESSLGTNRAHILDLIVLGRRDEWLNTFQEYRIASATNSSSKDSLFYRLIAIIQTLEFEIRETLKRRIKDEYKDFKYNLDNIKTEDDLLASFNAVSEVLDKLNITKIDTRIAVDTTDVEAVNVSKGI